MSFESSTSYQSTCFDFPPWPLLPLIHTYVVAYLNSFLPTNTRTHLTPLIVVHPLFGISYILSCILNPHFFRSHL